MIEDRRKAARDYCARHRRRERRECLGTPASPSLSDLFYTSLSPGIDTILLVVLTA
jgi:hypothetical protein